MRIRCHILGLLVVALIMNGCDQRDTFTAAEKQQVMSEAAAMLEQYHAAINKSGLMAEFDYLDNSGEFFWVPPGYHQALQYDSVYTILEQNGPTLTTVNFSWEQLTILPLSPEIASYHGIVAGHMTDTTGQQSSVRIIESGVLIKRSSGWKLLSGQSATLPLTND